MKGRDSTMGKILIGAGVIAGLLAVFFFVFLPHDMTKDDMLKYLDSNKSAYDNVGEYFRSHTEGGENVIYEQDAYKYKDIESVIKKALDNGFLYIKVSNDHKEITFGTSSASDDHRLIYSPYGAPQSRTDAETTKFRGWYIDM